MNAAAKLKHAKISAQKVRLVAAQIRRLPVERALEVLRYSPKKAARLTEKVLNSAIANAEHNAGADIDELVVETVQINEGSTQKRMRARAKGRGTRILKRTCHIEIVVSDAMSEK